MTIDNIFSAIEASEGITPQELKSKTRKQHVTICRKVASYLLFNECGLSKVGIGKILNQDHSTVIYQIAAMENALQGFDPKVLDCFVRVTDMKIESFQELSRLRIRILLNKEKDFITILKEYIRDYEKKEL